jgi:hypothetical protein
MGIVGGVESGRNLFLLVYVVSLDCFNLFDEKREIKNNVIGLYLDKYPDQ